MAEQTRTALPDSLMSVLRAAAASEEVSDHHLLEGALLVSFGYGLFERQDEIDPSTIAIPEEQWKEIASMLQRRGGDNGLMAVNLALAWMNSGPSGYADE